MRLSQLTEALGEAETYSESRAPEVLSEIEVTAVDYDSRSVSSGSLFCCLVGLEADGHDYAGAALQRGAVALLVEHPVEVAVPQVVVPDTRRAMALAAAAFEGNPSHRLDVVAVTGTNGKTTTASLVRSILETDGRPTGMIGTLTGARTTPEAPDLQRQLAAMTSRGLVAVAMEVSSHALTLHRVDGTHFRVAVFTNLGLDHLDFHADAEDYFAAKRRLFTAGLADVAVVNADDPYGRRLLDEAEIPSVPYTPSALEAVEVGLAGSRFRWRDHDVTVRLGGHFNVANALAAAEACLALGIAERSIVAGLANAEPVPGRFEVVPSAGDFTIIVDYAHTPEGLAQLLTAAADLADRDVVVVFGCGGDRDRSKRRPMGEVAARLASKVIVTSDNPRSEEPMAIIHEIELGVGSAAEVLVEPDRAEAIAAAVGSAEPGDVVVIAGKGHETTQVIGAETFPFDDRVVASQAVAALGGSPR